MTIKWTPEGKLDRYLWGIASPTERRAQRDRVADALDIAVAALRQALDFWRASGSLTADDVQSNVESALRQIGVEP